MNHLLGKILNYILYGIRIGGLHARKGPIRGGFHAQKGSFIGTYRDFLEWLMVRIISEYIGVLRQKLIDVIGILPSNDLDVQRSHH